MKKCPRYSRTPHDTAESRPIYDKGACRADNTDAAAADRPVDKQFDIPPAAPAGFPVLTAVSLEGLFGEQLPFL